MCIQERGGNGEKRYYESVTRSDRVNGEVVQSTVAFIGCVEEDQDHFLEVAYAERKPRLVWDDETGAQGWRQ